LFSQIAGYDFNSKLVFGHGAMLSD
jgi:hypothetical protein